MREKWYAFGTKTGIMPWTRVTEIIVIDKIMIKVYALVQWQINLNL